MVFILKFVEYPFPPRRSCFGKILVYEFLASYAPLQSNLLELLDAAVFTERRLKAISPGVVAF